MKGGMNRILVWFSCGAASAVAAKLAVETWRDRCEVCYCDLSEDEHPDNARFMDDVEEWIGAKVVRLRHPKYKTVEQVAISQSYLVGPSGAPCTKLLKREVRKAYQRDDDEHIFGLTFDEAKRIEDFSQRNSGLSCRWILRDLNITKADCYKIIQSANIELPAMYRLGFKNNNCIGCVKGGMGYWNKIREHFPETFKRRAALERLIGASILRRNGKSVWLDELKPDDGRDVKEPDIDCGVLCGAYQEDITRGVELLRSTSDMERDRSMGEIL